MRSGVPYDDTGLLSQMAPAGAGTCRLRCFAGWIQREKRTEGSQKLWLIAKGYRYEPEDLKKNGKFPCIIHWNFNHFLVLNGFRNDKAYLNDPAKGSYSVSMEEFDRSFTGICMMFEPDDGFEPGGKPKSMLSFARKRLVGAGIAVAFLVLTSVISSLLGVIQPVFSRIFMDRLLTGQNPDWLYPFIFALALFSAVQIIIAWIQAVWSLKIDGKLAVTGSAVFM